ncbi:MAG: hypothetical protein ACRDMV_07645 [Streptosporangiales bacterium]
MACRVRPANVDDLPAVAAITRRRRRRLADWEPEFWRMAGGADAAHEEWLRQAIDGHDGRARVLVSDDPADAATAHGADTVVGCAVSTRCDGWWFLDDFATADDGWWTDGMAQLLRTVEEKPTITCVPRPDVRKAACCAAAGMRPRSAYWVLRYDGATPATPAQVRRISREDIGDSLPPAAPHTFGAPLDPGADGVVLLGDEHGGIGVLGRREAPPVYDPGGTSGLVDRIDRKAPERLIDAATAAARERGDVQLVVVCPDDAPKLEEALIDRGFHRVADVYGWPGQGTP